MANKIRSDQIGNVYNKTETDTEIKNSIDAIQIGGRNLLLQSNTPVSIDGEQSYGFKTYVGSEFSNNHVQIGDYITIVVNIDVFADKTARIWLNGFSRSEENGSTYEFSNNKTENRTVAVVVKKRDNPTKLSLYNYGYSSTPEQRAGQKFKINWIKAVVGKKTSLDWTPAPEDQVSDWNQSDETAFDFIKNKPTADIAKGVQAFNWDNHATQGYLKSADLNGQATQAWVTSNFIPTSHPVNAVTGQNITNWNTAFTNNHTHANKTVLDGIAAANVTNWNNAHSYSQVGHIPLAQKGAVNGVASLDSNGQVPSEQLPSYVDDVIETANLTALNNLPLIQKMTGKIYVTLDTNRTYRWSGTQFIMIATGEVDSVNGKKGVVTLTSTDIPEGTNQYFTTARARASISGSTGVTYSSSTGAISVKYGATAGTAAQGNDSRINNGQTAYEWGNHRYAGYASGSWVESQLNNKVENGGGVKGFEISTDDRVMRGYILNYYGSDNTPIPVLTVSQGDDRYLSVTHPASGITAIQIFKWASAYEWGNHASAGYATQTWSNSNFIPKTHPVFNVTQAQINNWAIKDGSNASGIWKHAAYGLDLNPDINGSTLDGRGATTSLRNAIYGTVGGIVQDSADSPMANQWTNRIKILHSNSGGYFTELAHSFTGEEGLWHRRMSGGTLSPYVKLLDANNGVTLSGNQIINGHKSFIGTGNDYDYAGLEVTGNGSTVFPTLGFHQPGAYASSIQLKGGANFHFHAQGGSSYATITASSFFESSLRKYKTNIQPFTNSALDLIGKLDIVTYDRTEGMKDKIGIIADDSPKEFLSEKQEEVDLYKTIFIQAKAIQELKEEIDNLKKMITHVG